MDFDLSDEQREIQATARDLLATRCTPAAVRAAAESAGEDGALWREVSELGWLGIAIDERYGGQGLGLVELCVLLEQAGAALAPIPLLPSAGAALIIARAGSEEQRRQWLPRLADGTARGGFGAAFRGRAGGEALIAGAGDSDAILLVEHDAAGEDDGGGRGDDGPGDDGPGDDGRGDGAGRLLLGADASLPPLSSIDPLRSYSTRKDAEPRRGEPLPGDVEVAALAASVAVAAEAVGVCDRALQMTLAYVKERRQFDVPIGSFQAVSHRCAEMLLHTEQARSAVYHAAWAADAAPELLRAAASLAKALASEAVVNVTASAIQAHGGIGFTWEADVHWLFKRAQLNAQLMGGAGVHRRRLATAIGLTAS